MTTIPLFLARTGAALRRIAREVLPKAVAICAAAALFALPTGEAAAQDMCDMASLDAGTETCDSMGDMCLGQSPHSRTGAARNGHRCVPLTSAFRDMCESENAAVNPLGGRITYFTASDESRLRCVFPADKVSGTTIRQCELSPTDLVGDDCEGIFESARDASCSANAKYIFAGTASDGEMVSGCEEPTVDQCASNGGQGPCHADATCLDSQMTTTEADADICTCDDSTHTGDGTAAGTGCVAPAPTVDQCASNGGQGPCHADATCLDSQMTTTEADADICTCDDSTHTGDGTAAGTGCVAPAVDRRWINARPTAARVRATRMRHVWTAR